MKIKNLVSLGTALTLGLSSLFIIALPQTADAAAPYTCTWTGASNNNFATAGNWSGCNGAAPVNTDNDNLVFDNTSLGANATLNNNISNLSLGSITFQGTNSSSFDFSITGNALTVNSGITQSANVNSALNLDVTLGADQTFNFTTASDLVLGDATQSTTHTLALGSHTLTLSGSTACGGISVYSALTGSGALHDNVTSAVLLAADSPGYSGAIAVNSGELAVNTSQGLGAASAGTTVASGAVLNLGYSSDTTYAEPLTLAGTGISSGGTITTSDPVANLLCAGGGASPDSPHTATLSGDIMLQSDVTVNGDANHNVAITGGLSGSFAIGVVPGAATTLTVNSSNNTSNTPNGTITAPATTITVAAGDNQPSTAVTVGKNVTEIIDGTRGAVDVQSGGTLKGSGTVGSLTVESGGTVAPGHSPGCLNTGDLNLNGTYQAELGGTTACSGYDQLNVTGAVTIGSGTPATLAVSLYGGFQPKVGDSFTIINNDSNDPVTGTFNNLPEGATFTVSGYVFKITYAGGDGNDVVLTVQSLPSTPNTGFALLRSNPVITLAATTLAAGGMAVIARRYQKVTSKR